jgi:hypothetical protein
LEWADAGKKKNENLQVKVSRQCQNGQNLQKKEGMSWSSEQNIFIFLYNI